MSHTYKDSEHCNTKMQLNKEFQPKTHENNSMHQHFLYKKFRTLIERTSCFANTQSVVVGLSGGVDSSVLLHLLCAYQKHENGPKVFALHMHHGQRGDESDRDAFAAHEIASRYDCPFGAIKLNAQPGMSEDELRKLRHEKMKDFAQTNKFDRIVLGHHMDDQVETFLFRLIRGSDVRGLTGMKPFDGKVVRPLLECTREEIEKTAEEFGLTFVTDSSNFSTSPSRNFIRNIVIPSLKAKLDPRVSEHIADLSQSLLEVETIIQAQVDKMIEECRVGEVGLSVLKMRSIEPAIRKRMIQTMFRYIIKDKGAMSRDQIEMVDGWIENTQSPKYLLLPHQVRVEKSNGVLTFSMI